MTDLRKAAEMALEALNMQTPLDQREFELRNAAIEALRQALAQPEWVGLTDEEARDISFNLPIKWTGHLQGAASIYDFARAIEAKLKEKNT